jgi:single-strand DNA-binding protein
MNKVTVIGWVVRGPEMRRTSGGQPVTTFAISARRRWTTNAGESRQSTERFNVVAWGRLAEAIDERIKVNQRVYVQGNLQTRTWDDDTGQRQARTEVVAETVIPVAQPELAEQSTGVEPEETMPLCLNQVMVIGNLGRDPEMRYTPGGQAVTSFSLAATRKWTTPSGERRDTTEWFNIVAWGSLAEICNQYLTKGRRVCVEGELRTRKWEHPDGKPHYRTELVANEMIMLGPRPRSKQASHDGAHYGAPQSDAAHMEDKVPF